MSKLLFLFFFATAFCVAQKNSDPTPEEIAEAKILKIQYPNDDLVLLESKDYVTFDFDTNLQQVSVKHQINEELMNISSRTDIQKHIFYDGQSEVSDFGLKYRNNKSAYFKVKDEAYTVEEFFFNDARVKYASVDFPVQGYKYFFEATKNIFDIKYFTSLYFTDAYPIIKKEITLVVPKWLNLEIKEMNFEGFQISKTTTFDEKQNADVLTYSVSGLDAVYKEEQSPGPSYIYPHLLVLAKSYTNGGERYTLFNETKDLYNWYKSLVDSMADDTSVLKEKVAELTANAKTDEEKIKNIYYWIQDNIRYIAFEDGLAGFKPDECQNVFKKRYGDCKGMANLTKQMLMEAGFDARLTWLGTKRIAYDYSTPSLSVDNHMICTVFYDGKKIFLDGTEKFNPFGEYAERIQGKQVMIEDGDSFILETVPVVPPETNKETHVFNAKINDNALEGKVSLTYSGESRASFLYVFNNLRTEMKNEALEYYLKRADRNMLVANIKTSDLENRDDQLSIDFNLKQANAVSSFDDEIYINLDYNQEYGKWLFNERNTDYEFAHKEYLSSEINLELPEGYKVAELPKGIDVNTKHYKIFVDFELSDNVLHYKKVFVMKDAVVRKSNFKEWDETIKSLQSIYNQQIILVKD
ncbi:transglutaminase-like domain-containing protein [Aequorivita todarodis]|uniref:transglutaminase-like domain-containing protein n=1 Tax=Aequorivita todarodis TaxID=2036821 RepID=UPI002350CA8F|nr:transglutaminase-like domain-containing protein [Aequorivita todarodis]MDC7999466.1 transglutaminase-like domain-containing protein [Aequorivita todarodis]